MFKKVYINHYEICPDVMLTCEICKKVLKRRDFINHTIESCYLENLTNI